MKKFKTFDLKDSAVLLFLGLGLAFTVTAVVGIVAIRDSAEPWPPGIVLGATWAGACYVIYRFFKLRQDYQKTIFGYSALGFEISREPNIVLISLNDIDTIEAEIYDWFSGNYQVPAPFGSRSKLRKIRFTKDPIPMVLGGTARGLCDGTEILIHRHQETYANVISTLGHELGHFVLFQAFPELHGSEHHLWMKEHKFPYA